MSAKPENSNEYYKRKLMQIKEYIETAIANPTIVQSVFIGDGVAIQTDGRTGIPVINLKVDLKESLYHQLTEKK